MNKTLQLPSIYLIHHLQRQRKTKALRLFKKSNQVSCREFTFEKCCGDALNAIIATSAQKMQIISPIILSSISSITKGQRNSNPPQFSYSLLPSHFSFSSFISPLVTAFRSLLSPPTFFFISSLNSNSIRLSSLLFYILLTMNFIGNF